VSRKKDKQPCARPGCEKGGFFHGFCTADFKVHFGISLKEYKANKAFKGEPPDAVAARIKSIDISKMALGKVSSVKDVRINGHLLNEFDPTVERIAPGIAATAVIFPQDIWDKVSEIADKEFRTPDQQILYMVHATLESSARSTAITLEMSQHAFKQRLTTLIETDPQIRAMLGK